MAAVQRLVERDAEAELVGGGLDRLAAPLLGRHVRGRADQLVVVCQVDVEAVAGGRRRVDRRQPLGGADEAEVEDADAAGVVDHDVARLEVAVDQTGGVGGCQAAPGLDEDVDDLRPSARRRVEPGGERHAADELHRHVYTLVGASGLEHGDDVRVRHAGHPLRLADQPQLGVRIGVVQQLDGDLAVEEVVVGGVHDAHRALAEAIEDREAADPRGRHGRGDGARGEGLGDVDAGLRGEQGPVEVVSDGRRSRPVLVAFRSHACSARIRARPERSVGASAFMAAGRA
ncbi:MAG TPA: hypothetical protein VIK91_09860 [Nannocystis sp.]